MISATVLTKNSEETLETTLVSLTRLPEVIVYDTGSTDRTLEIANRFPNVKIVQAPFEGFGKAHNAASAQASYDWIFSVDSDEVPSPELINEILRPLDPHTVYFVNRHNYFNKKRIKGCSGWYPDWIPRIYNRKKTRFSDDLVHERIVTTTTHTQKLTSPLLHTPYRSAAQFLQKMQNYAALFAKQHPDKRSSLKKALLHSWASFIKSYIFKRGFLCGKEGYIISLYNAHTTYYKYLLLAA